MKNMKTKILSRIGPICLATVMAVLSARADEAPMTMKAGDTAPLVTGKDQQGRTWKLSRLIGKKNVLLYFYPKDETPGCTKEACSMRDDLAQFKRDNVDVVGVSFDSEASHQDFIKKESLNFPLLADTDGKISDAYGARKPGKDMDRRVSFLISKDGKIVHVTDSPDPAVHMKEMREAISGLKK
jgi:peroxiredoxin Q/BCP